MAETNISPSAGQAPGPARYTSSRPVYHHLITLPGPPPHHYHPTHTPILRSKPFSVTNFHLFFHFDAFIGSLSGGRARLHPSISRHNHTHDRPTGTSLSNIFTERQPKELGKVEFSVNTSSRLVRKGLSIGSTGTLLAPLMMGISLI